MEVLRRCLLAIAQRLVHCAIAVSTAVLDRVTKTMSVAPLLTNNLDNSKQKTSNLLSPAPPPYSWSLLGKCEGPAPPPSSKISWSFDLAWNPLCLPTPLFLPLLYLLQFFSFSSFSSSLTSSFFLRWTIICYWGHFHLSKRMAFLGPGTASLVILAPPVAAGAGVGHVSVILTARGGDRSHKSD